jgi:hypothetical protein
MKKQKNYEGRRQILLFLKSLQAILKNILAALQREWGTSDQPLTMPAVNGNKYSSAA